MRMGKLTVTLLAATWISCSSSTAWAQLPFFPGAEGFGGNFTGSVPAGGWFSNATVYRVTNLNDSGAGSLRGAFQENTANRIIVFDVGGVIQLTSGSLDIKNVQNYYIAGQTAPTPVTVYGNTSQITHSNNKQHFNTILRYMSFRKGTGDGEDAITFGGGGTEGIATNMILDHVSGSWAEDEILSVTNYNTNVTVQYSMINDALVSGHAYGSLLRPKTDSNVTFHHNLYAHNASRQARFGTYDAETLTADFRNNVVYNFRDRASYAGGSSEAEREFADVNYVGNYIVAGPGTTGNPNIAFSVDKNMDARVYQSGNFVDPDNAPGGAPADGVLDGADLGWSAFTFGGLGSPVQTLTQMASPFATAPVTTQAASAAYSQIVDYVGNFWWARDAIDARVISNVTDFTGVPIGAAAPIASELSGLLATPMTSHAVGYDADNDGMQDAWETVHGGNLVWNQDFDSDGYINLIEFINEKGEFPAPAPIVFNGAQNTRYANIMNWKTDDGGITAGSNWQPSKYDLAVVNNGIVLVDAVGQHAGLLQIAPDAGNNAIVSISTGWLNAAEGVEVGSAAGDGTLNVGGGTTLFAPVVAIGAMGELSGSGDIVGNVLNEGLVSPGSSPGTLDVSGNFAQNGSGILKMEIAAAANFDQLVIGGALMAGGTLGVDLLSYSPIEGDSFDLFDFASSLGSFTLDLPALTAGLVWDDTDLLTTGELAVISATIAEDADFDADGDVDGRDFLIWQRGFSGVGALATGDANADGDVDADDLAIWQNQYGSVPEPAATNVAVPEPSSILLAVATGLLLGSQRKRTV
jgi:hypothetical protein